MSWTGHRPLTRAVLERLLQRLYAATQPPCSIAECAFVAVCELIAAAHNRDLATYFRDSPSDVLVLAADGITRLGEPALAARLLAMGSSDTYEGLTAEIDAGSERLDAALEHWAQRLCREREPD